MLSCLRCKKLEPVRSTLGSLVLLCVLALLPGCTSPREYIANRFKVGPNYQKPPAPVANDWIDTADKRIRTEPDDLARWWTVFNDPILDSLICYAYRQNLSLREAGFRVLEARAQFAIARGQFFPQAQFAHGDFTRSLASKDTTKNVATALNRYATQIDLGFNVAWELDFWGRFRRAIESASASLDASVES